MYLISQIVVFLALAALIGFLTGWYWQKCRRGPDAKTAAERDAAIAQRNSLASKAQSEIADLRARLAAAPDLTALKRERDGAVNAHGALQQELQALRNRVASAPNPADVEALKRTIADLEGQRVTAVRHGEDLKAQLNAALSLEGMRRERDAALSSNAALEVELAGARAARLPAPAFPALDLEPLRLQARQVEAHTQAVQRGFENLRAQLGDHVQLRRDLEEARAAKATAEAQLAAWREAQASAGADPQTLHAQWVRASAERDGALSQVQTLTAQLKAAADAQAARRERDDALASKGALEAELAHMRGLISSAPSRVDVDALRARLADAEAHRTITTRQLDDLRARLASVPDVDAIARARDAAVAESARLSRTLESLRAQLGAASPGPTQPQPVTAAGAVTGSAWSPSVGERGSPSGRVSALAALDAQRLEAQIDAAGAGSKPITLVEPLTMAPDNLQAIKGVTPAIEHWLNRQGVFFYWQIGTLDARGAAWLVRNLPASGQSVHQDHWIAQAAQLMRAAR